jgi:hypothetical protein
MARGDIEMEIENSLTGKKVLAKAHLSGGGTPTINPGAALGEPKGPARMPLKTGTAVKFEDFEGTNVTITRLDLRFWVGGTSINLQFPWLSSQNMFLKAGFSVGKYPGGYNVWGYLHLLGNTSDDINPVEDVSAIVEQRSAEGLIITFPTGEYTVPKSGRDQLESFLAVWSRRLGWPTSPLTSPDPAAGALSPATVDALRKLGLGKIFDQ